MDRSLLCICFLLAISFTTQAAEQHKCLYISSYHKGYAWSDGIEKALYKTLGKTCQIKQFEMDSKRKKTDSEIILAAIKAKALIESWQPDIVITSDDNAVKYLLQPYFKNSRIPFVFCGVNWSTSEYGLPYSNTTGMVEIAPVKRSLDTIKEQNNLARNIAYLGADTLTEAKNMDRFIQISDKYNFTIHPMLATNSEQWLEYFKQAQKLDAVIIGSNAGISDWNNARISEKIKPIGKKLSVTNHQWMMHVSMIGFTRIPEEQGEWAGLSAIEIINGMEPSKIPIIPNRKWDIWSNIQLLGAADLRLPASLIKKSKKAL